MKLLLKHGHLIDRLSPFHKRIVDILIEDDRIEKIAPEIKSDADQVIELGYKYVSAGWIDMHVHCFEGTTDLGVEADRIGVETGVVCIADAGSCGEANIDEFYQQVKDKKTIVKSWINIASSGLINRHELKDKNNVNIEKTLKKIEEYPDFVVGIKLRASASVMGEDTVTPFEWAQEASKRSEKPIMVHFGNYPPAIDDILKQLKPGDVLTHCFHGKPNGIMEGDLVRPLVLQKRQEGVQYDVGHGEASFSYNVAYRAMKAGFYPDSITTDLHRHNIDAPVVNLANVITKFYHLGYELEDLIHYITMAPATIMNSKDEFGKVEEGMKAHLTVFEILDEEKELVDSQEEKIPVKKVIQTTACFVNGKMEVVKNDKTTTR